jgi:hypothetical protein
LFDPLDFSATLLRIFATACRENQVADQDNILMHAREPKQPLYKMFGVPGRIGQQL